MKRGFLFLGILLIFLINSCSQEFPNEVQTPDEGIDNVIVVTDYTIQKEIFKSWATANNTEKNKYALRTLSGYSIPNLSSGFFDMGLKNFSLIEKKICPKGQGCFKPDFEWGYELQFDVEISGLYLESGYVRFNKDNIIVDYDGLRTDINPKFISEKEAHLLARNGCEKEGLVLSEKRAYAKEVYGDVHWFFGLNGEIPKHCFYVECIVNAATNETEIGWRCGGVG